MAFDLLKSLDAVRDRADLTTTQKCVIAMLTLRADSGGRCHPSYGRIAKDASVARPTAMRTVSELVTMGLLIVEKRRDQAGDQTSNVYTIDVGAGGEGVVTQDYHPVIQDDQGGLIGRPGVVTQDYQGGHPMRPRRNPVKEPNGRNPGKTSRSRAAPTLFAIEPESEPATGGEHQRVISAYVEGYERIAQVKPTIDGRIAKAAKVLRESYGVDEAVAIIGNAYADPFWGPTKPLLHEIVTKADKFRGAASTKARPGVQPVPPEGSAWIVGSGAEQ